MFWDTKVAPTSKHGKAAEIGPNVEEWAEALEERIEEVEDRMKEENNRRPVVSPVPETPTE